jgi:hypothetical protein
MIVIGAVLGQVAFRRIVDGGTIIFNCPMWYSPRPSNSWPFNAARDALNPCTDRRRSYAPLTTKTNEAGAIRHAFNHGRVNSGTISGILP